MQYWFIKFFNIFSCDRIFSNWSGFVLSQIKWWMLLLILSFPVLNKVNAQEKIIPNKISFSLELGNWQPNTLNNELSFSTFGAAGATPYVGFSFCIPVMRDVGLRLSAGYWSLGNIEKVDEVHSLVIHPVCVDIKYWLVPESFVSAYVIYGGGIYWGSENETDPFGKKMSKARAGWGCKLGAGFDISVTKNFGAGISCTYLYVKFSRELGGVDDFSGLKISGIFYYYL